MSVQNPTRSYSPTSIADSNASTPRSGDVTPTAKKPKMKLVKGQHIELEYAGKAKIEVIFKELVLCTSGKYLRCYTPSNLIQSNDHPLKGVRITPLDKHTDISLPCAIL